MSQKKVLLGLSGGVDSAVAACLLLRQGYQVYGHWLDIRLGGRTDAERVAGQLGIPFSTGDIRQDLEQHVCKPFIRDYLEGRTPLPCARCNPSVKFPALFRAAEAVGAGYIATGHYARIVQSEQGEPQLCRGRPKNDQVYLLARLPQEYLKRILFPLGEFEKTQVRALAREFDLPVSEKPDSMEICFVPDNDYAAWLEQHGTMPPPGAFVDRTGRVLGQHQGIHHYTLGQRRGLGIPAETRLFVTEIRPETNEVVLSDGSDLYAQRVWCRDWNPLATWDEAEPITVRLRHSKVEYPVRLLHCQGESLLLELTTKARAPTPGQLAVFYRGDVVLGSAWIDRGEREYGF